ncbi:hypothetical protein VIBNISFn27_1100002 [Vibrio nigripulchritudo SFn27]|uniref:Uncharacterized protein n=1 Tax=Vibrio nigripulchritudo TaxID=28173 RepID=U4JXC3_9VIBR|nr:hypothetical protein VIBNIBLFn1_970002 [Vibrio nigripulchritudo BLFn1]CCN86664.1 hypothetical protein VIBNISFn27_1100002 [Vibrio nigripulchritudo SFn27]CCN95951.1 hypothetical protein VIBNIENn2_660002 [Vibrio nigripulchritudo ENn2]CCO43281.1 hypothetical protein VIBNISFn135_950002 [Vibrio nigripulchritudo SFn135]CCO53724.1 hypothetical protein VIBNIWn13_560109 [Vibrio nigripulchritudo Wn13]CCO57575.1 hypothetical protein VIBNI_A1448 [Vibrio nigripulchritudo]
MLKKHCHIECYDPELLKRDIVSGKGFPCHFELFKEQLREAIDEKLISPFEYEQLTEEDFDSIEDLS